MIKCEIVREKLFLEEERPSIGVQSENGCPFIDDDCCLHWGGGVESGICEAKSFGTSFL